MSFRPSELRLYNTRSRSIEPFASLVPERVGIYVCGLTPSAEAHLGHARSFLFFDVLRRYLVHCGYRVRFVRNVTDIDDRSIAAARAEGVDFRDIVGRYQASFGRSMDRLHVLEPDSEPHATAYVPQIVEMIARLIEAGHAYVAADGVYYAVASFARYGALSGRRTEELLVGARIAPGEDKRDPLDFALWKLAKPGEPAWASPWGDGRPGWHIECSAMSHALLGEPFDIHGGGYDLVFPHHENEIAQSEALYGAPMARYWVHGGLLQFDGRKMSKSLGNFEPLATLLDRHDPQAIRLLFLQAGYRKPLNFTEAGIDGATTGLRRLLAAYDSLRHGAAGSGDAAAVNERVALYERRFYDALDDDMNTAGASGVLFELAASASDLAAAGAASRAAGFLHEAMGLLGISPAQRSTSAVATTTLTFDLDDVTLARPVGLEKSNAPDAADPPPELALLGDPTASPALTTFFVRGPENADDVLPAATVEALQAALGKRLAFNGESPAEAVVRVIVARRRAKAARDFALADALRQALTTIGVALRDSKEGVTWSVAA